MSYLLHLDFETFCEVDIGKCGAHKYTADPSLALLLTSWARDDDPVTVDEGLPYAVMQMLADPECLIVAFNAQFERLVLRALGYDLPPERFVCTGVLAYMLSFTGSLSDVCKQMEFPVDKQKNDRAKRMMLKFCKPRRPSKHDARTRWTKSMDPAGWEEFRAYGGQDVVASREICRRAAGYVTHPRERAMWLLDQAINDRGWPIDTELVANANTLRLAEEARLLGEMKTLTGLENPNSVPQLKAWLADECTVEVSNLQAETVDGVVRTLASGMHPDQAHAERALAALRLRQQLARATPKKWAALARATDTDGRLRGTLRFAGASRTQRWSGRLFQPQNLFSERVYDPAVLAEVVKYADLATLTALYEDAQRALSGAIRSAVTAGPGRQLVVCDKSGIESRLLGWLSGEERINGIFRRGEDTYRDLASRVFNIPIEDVTKAQRTFCKPAELGCGYMLSARGLDAYAEGMGVDMAGRSPEVVDIWRQSNPAVVQMWDWFDAVLPEVVTHGTTFEGYRVRIRRDEDFLVIDLPSGRPVYYFRPEMAINDWGRWSVSYMGRYQDEGGRWQRVFSHPGKTTENIDQAVARDCLRDDMRRLNEEVPCAPIVGHVHDEAVLEAVTELAELVLAIAVRIMGEAPAWAPGLVLAAEGFITTRYRK